jgi:hypothetical protein
MNYHSTLADLIQSGQYLPTSKKAREIQNAVLRANPYTNQNQ